MSALSSVTHTTSSSSTSTSGSTPDIVIPESIQNMIDFFSSAPVSLVAGALFGAGSSALAAGLFTAVSPLGGAIFGATRFVGSRVVGWICDKVNCAPDSKVAAVAKGVLSVIGGIGAGCAALSLAGHTWTAGSIAGIYLGSFLTAIPLAIPVLCAGLAVGGVALVYTLFQNGAFDSLLASSSSSSAIRA